MIMLTNGQASAFNSNVIAKLFSDSDRQFPIPDAFRISDTIQLIQNRLPAYKIQLKKIIEDNGGVVDASGIVNYPDAAKASNAQEQVDELNKIEIKIPVDPIDVGPQWPALTLAEATILRPILNGTKVL